MRSTSPRRSTLLKNIDITLLPNFLEDKMDRKVTEALAKGGKSRHLVALVERGGWFAAGRFVRWMTAKLDAGKRPDGTPRAYSKLTLQQFFDRTGVDLSMVASDTTRRQATRAESPHGAASVQSSTPCACR